MSLKTLCDKVTWKHEFGDNVALNEIFVYVIWWMRDKG